MPYKKEIGKSPVYVFGVRRRLFKERVSRILNKEDVPHIHEGMFMVFEDSFDAYVEEVVNGTYRRGLLGSFWR